MAQSVILLMLLVTVVAGTSVARIGFHAKLGYKQTVGRGATVRFNLVTLNNNGGNSSHYGYNPSTGHFVCPVSGLYTFGVHLMTYGKRMEFQMKKDSEVIMSLLLNGVNGKYNIDSGTVDTECKRGENVYVFGFLQGPVGLHYSWNWFTGHLVEAYDV